MYLKLTTTQLLAVYAAGAFLELPNGHLARITAIEIESGSLPQTTNFNITYHQYGVVGYTTVYVKTTGN